MLAARGAAQLGARSHLTEARACQDGPPAPWLRRVFPVNAGKDSLVPVL